MNTDTTFTIQDFNKEIDTAYVGFGGLNVVLKKMLKELILSDPSVKAFLRECIIEFLERRKGIYEHPKFGSGDLQC